MANRFTYDARPDLPDLRVNNSWTALLVELLARSARHEAVNQEQTKWAAFFTSHDQAVVGLGTICSDLSRWPWNAENTDDEKAFLLRVIRGVVPNRLWEQAGHPTEVTVLSGLLDRLAVLVEAFDACDIALPVRRLLEVIVTDAADAGAAAAAGADRLELIALPELGGMTPSPDTVRHVLDATRLPVRVMIRRTEHHRLTGDELAILRNDVESLQMAEAFVFGAVDSQGMPDPALQPVVEAFGGRPWTFHRAVDDAPDLAAAVRAALALPGCDHVLTAGSSLGIDAGLRRLEPLLTQPGLRSGLLIGGGVNAGNLSHVLASGAGAIHLGRAVRAGRSWSGPIDAGLVRTAAGLIHAGA